MQEIRDGCGLGMPAEIARELDWIGWEPVKPVSVIYVSMSVGWAAHHERRKQKINQKKEQEDS